MVGTHPLVMRKTTLTADEVPEGHQFYHYLIDGAVYGRDHENGKPWGVEALVQRLRSFRFCN